MLPKEKTPKPAKEKTFKEWSEFSFEAYQHALSQMIHFSFKTVNTNAAPGGVRVSSDDALRLLPYVSVRTLLGVGLDVRLDRWEGAGKARIYGQIGEIEDGRTEGVPADILSLVKERLTKTRKTRLVAGGEHISSRLRQILLPKEGSYVAITPMSSAGVSREIQIWTKAHRKKIQLERKAASDPTNRTLQSIRTASFSIGGSNSQNAGGLIYMMQNLLFFSAPRADGDSRLALSIYHKGIQLPLSKGLMTDYLKWHESIKGAVTANLGNREVNKQFVHRFTRFALRSGEQAKAVLLEHKEVLPSAETTPEGQEQELLGADVAAWAKGLIDRRFRDSGWERSLAVELARGISTWKPQEGKPLTLPQGEINTLSRLIEEALR